MKLLLFIVIQSLITRNVYCALDGLLCARSSITGPQVTEELSDENDETLEPGEEIESTEWTIDPDTGIQYVKCTSQAHYCYALWREDASGNGTIIIGQGCWESSGRQGCEQNQCISYKKPPKALNNTKFCCCSGNFCNVNVTDSYVPVVEEEKLPPTTGHLDQQALNDRQTVIVWSVSICSLLFAIFVTILVYHIWQARRASLGGAKSHPNPDQQHLIAPGFTVGLYSVDHLKLCSIVGQGRYGSVWKGIVNEQEVAVKIFPAHHRTYFYNERDIYCLPFMDNPALLSYYGCDERTNLEGQPEYLLVLSYAPNGCLQDYLKENVLDFLTFCKMASSVAKGLAHLHTDIIKGDKIKSCVTHRDLNTRNILVKDDLSCCLCDLGFAMKLSGSRYYQNGEEQHAETRSITEVGTRRYMAPEVLEGAVNLRDCEASLKQVDVYALGLVLWELATRCQEFYCGGEVQPYRLPFQQEIGLHPTLEQMQTLVSRRKARPLFPVQWRETAAAKLIRDTAEDCWDQDAEARLTALCVEERLNELPILRDRHNRATIYSTSPTFNSTLQNPTIINNNNNLTVNVTNTPMQDISPNQTPKDIIYDMSNGTVETLLSPTEGVEHPFKNSNETAAYIVNEAPLQPYQGRNPCLERNLMLPTNSTDNLQFSSTLIDKSFKHNTDYRSNSNTTESQGLIPNDFLTTINRSATPIPYVQNVGNLPNLPKTQNTNTCNIESTKTKLKWNGLRKLIDKKLFGRERLEEELKSNLVKLPIVVMETEVNLVRNNKNTSNEVVTSVLQEDSISTGSSSSNSSSRRPSTLPLKLPKQIKTSDSTSGINQIIRRKNNNNLMKQQSLEQFTEVFSSTSDLSRLKDPSQRIKTPGDVPPSVRRNRGKNVNRFSLYDDRMMSFDSSHWTSVPDDIDITVETVSETLHPPEVEHLKCNLNRDSVSSF